MKSGVKGERDNKSSFNMCLKDKTDIDKKNLLPPLMVIQILAHNSTATLSVVKVRSCFLKICTDLLQNTLFLCELLLSGHQSL